MLLPNAILQNRYLIIRSIGQGGMGAVYLAQDKRLGNTVALKETFFTDALMRRAFEREARLLASLRHPALPKVIDHFDEGDGQFLVMEFIPGDDLDHLLAQRGQPFPPERVLTWADQLLEALEYLHTQETPILHRDIKPSNLKLTSRDQIILLDFGLAKGTTGQLTGADTSKSVPGFTPSFASIEQIQGAGTDPRSDLYSLAATLYYLMTGTIPASALSRATASIKELSDPLLPAHGINPWIAPEVAAVLRQALALNPNRRPSSAAAMRNALDEAGQHQPGVASSESKTLVLPSTVADVATSRRGGEQETMSALLPTVQSPGIAFSGTNMPRAVSTTEPALSETDRQSFAKAKGPVRNLAVLPWIIGGFVALLILGVAITWFVIDRNSKPPPPPQANVSAEADNSGVAARVNGKPIMLSEVDRKVSEQAKGKQAELSPLELRQAQLQVLGSLIQREALFQRAEKEKLLPTEEQITATIKEQQQQGGMTDVDFQKALKEQKLTFEELREEARRDLAISSLQDKWTGKITIDEREVKDFFLRNRQRFVSHRGVGLAMVAVDPADNSQSDDAKSDTQAKLKIDMVYQKLRSGGDFATVARERSEDSNSRASGGDLGFATEDDLKQNAFPSELTEKFFGSMSVGDITAPVRFNSGKWYVFKLTDKRLQNIDLTLESPGVREEIAKALEEQRKQISNAELLETAMNDTKIINYLAANKPAVQK